MQKSILRIVIIVALILLIPLLGNIFAEGANWGVFDFIVMGGLLFITGIAIDFVIRRVGHPIYRNLAVAAILFTLILIWTELAVGAVSRSINLLF